MAILAAQIEHDSWNYSALLNNRSVTYLAGRRGAEALRDLAEAEGISERLFGPLHWDTLDVRASRATALAYLGRIDEAQQALAPIREQLTSKPNLDALLVCGLVERFAGDATVAPDDTNCGAGAGSHRGRGCRSAQGGTAPRNVTDSAASRTGEVLVGLGRVDLVRGAPAAALPCLEQADDFWCGFDAENPWAGEAAFWLGRCYQMLGRVDDARNAFARAEPILVRSPLPSDAAIVRTIHGQ